MYCLTCNGFAQLKVVAEQIEASVPGIEEVINAFLMWHLAVVHNLAYQDLRTQVVAPPSNDQKSRG